MSAYSFEQKGEPLDYDVNISPLPTFVSPPKEVPHGLNEIDICAFTRPNVTITTDSGEPCKVTGITFNGPSSWHVTYIIPAPPLTDSVHITAQALEKKVITVPCTKTLAIGTRVVRGPHWIGGDGDGGPGSVGVVEGYYSEGIQVQWQGKSRGHWFKPFHFRIKTVV